MGLFKSVWEKKNHEKMIDYALKLCEKGEYAEVISHIRFVNNFFVRQDAFNSHDVLKLVSRMTDEKQIADFLIAGGSIVENTKFANIAYAITPYHKQWVNLILDKITDEELLARIVIEIDTKYAGSSKIAKAPLLCRSLIMKMTNENLLNKLLGYEHIRNNAQERLQSMIST